MVKINGAACEVDGQGLGEYLAGAGYDIRRVAAELNGEIVPKADFGGTVLADGDELEVVSFVGGG